MGAPHSPPAANLGLTHAERSFVDRTLLTQGPAYVRDSLRNFHPFTRYIDDLGHEFNEIPTVADYYGMSIIRTGASPPDEQVDLLSYTFRRTGGIMQAAFKNKQKGFPILLTRYPSHFSTITEECRVGCVVGGLVSIYRVIYSPMLFADAVKDFFDVLRARRFSYMTVSKGIRTFLRRNCKREYHGFLITHFFAEILSTWPYKVDVPSSKAIEEEKLRHDLHEDVPSFVLNGPNQANHQQQPHHYTSRFHQVSNTIAHHLLRRVVLPIGHLFSNFVHPFGFGANAVPRHENHDDDDSDRFFDCVSEC
jgi:hypothetical protein